MSFLNQSGELKPIQEVLPAGLVPGLTSSQTLLQRKTIRVSPQGAATGVGANQNVNFLLSGNGGMIDPLSARLNFNVVVTEVGGSSSCPDDGHPFKIWNVNLGGQGLEAITDASKLTNMNMALGGSQSYYRTAGGFQGFNLLNGDNINAVFASSTNDPVGQGASAWGTVQQNQPACASRASRAASAQTNNQAGTPVSIPLSLISGFFRCKKYIPDMLGDLTLMTQTCDNTEYLFNRAAAGSPTYVLNNISVTYDVVFPDPRYTEYLRGIMTNPNDQLLIAYESDIVSTGAQITGSIGAASVTPATAIVSRATSMLTKLAMVLCPTNGLTNYFYPSQSCFPRSGLSSLQVRIGSSVYPSTQPAQGTGELFSLALSAYGSPTQENGTVITYPLYTNSTLAVASNTPTIYENQVASFTAATTGSATRFAYSDKAVFAVGFRSASGGSEPADLDGVSLSQSSGAQAQVVFNYCAGENLQPYVALTAIRMIKVSGGAVSIVGA